MDGLHRTSSTSAPRSETGRLLILGGVAVAVSILANLSIYALANAIASQPIVDPNSGDELSVAPVIVATIVGVAAAVGVFALVVRRLRWSARTFVGIAVAALLVSLLPLLLTADLSTATRSTLTLMHVVTATIVVTILTARAASR